MPISVEKRIQVFNDLLFDVTLIISYLFIIGLLSRYFHAKGYSSIFTDLKPRMIAGCLFGILGMILMYYSIQVTTHVIIDLRHIAIILAATFFGFPAAIVSALIISLSRFYIGGLSDVSFFASLFTFLVGITCAFLTRISIKKDLKAIVLNIASIIVLYISFYVNLELLSNEGNKLSEIYPNYWFISLIGGIFAHYVAKYIFGKNELFFELQNTKKRLSLLLEQYQEANEILTEMSSLDGLTRIPNRRFYDETLGKEWKRAIREKKNLSLIMLDIDQFKVFNDTYGHLLGDDCLQKVAQALKSTVKRSGDFVARYGGEEFSVILPNTDEDGALRVAENLRSTIESLEIPNINSKVKPYVTISVGVATIIPTEEIEFCELINLADKALYSAKENGRNQVRGNKISV